MYRLSGVGYYTYRSNGPVHIDFSVFEQPISFIAFFVVFCFYRFFLFSVLAETCSFVFSNSLNKNIDGGTIKILSVSPITTTLNLITQLKVKSYIYKQVPKNRVQATCVTFGAN